VRALIARVSAAPAARLEDERARIATRSRRQRRRAREPPALLLARLAALGMGAGALGYSAFWLLAGMRAPGLGSTGAAKDSLEWLAVPTAGALIAGLVLAIVVTTRALFATPRPG